MHNLKNILLGIVVLMASCGSNQKLEQSSTKCGIHTDEIEMDLSIEDPYGFPMASEAFSAINDTIRNHMPDTVEFEIFLAAMNKEAIAIYIFAPKSVEYVNTISCAIMNTDFQDFVPKQKYMLYYSYVEDPEATMPLEASIKKA